MKRLRKVLICPSATKPGHYLLWIDTQLERNSPREYLSFDNALFALSCMEWRL